MSKSLSANQQKAARLIAGGLNNLEIADKCDVSESTILRWKRLEQFKQAIAEEKRRSAAEQFEKLLPDDDDMSQSLSVERKQLEKLDEIINKLAELTTAIIDSTDAEDVSPRAIPGFMKALTSAVDCRRIGADRIDGIEAILDELGKAEKVFSEKVSTT